MCAADEITCKKKCCLLVCDVRTRYLHGVLHGRHELGDGRELEEERAHPPSPPHHASRRGRRAVSAHAAAAHTCVHINARLMVELMI